jgi:hypothetical protein
MSLTLTYDEAQSLGGEEAVTAAVAAFTKALNDHRFTIDVPAPTAPHLIELIVRGGGEFTVEPAPDAPKPTPPISADNPSGFTVADWQMRKALIANGYDIDAIETALKAIEDQQQRQMMWMAWDRPTVLEWDNFATQDMLRWLDNGSGVLVDADGPTAYAKDLWFSAHNYVLNLTIPPAVGEEPQVQEE